MKDETDAATGDLFEPPSKPEHEVPASQGVYCDMGLDELFYIGEVQMPRPMPTELVIEIDGWDYYFKLDARQRSAK